MSTAPGAETLIMVLLVRLRLAIAIARYVGSTVEEVLHADCPSWPQHHRVAEPG